MTSNLCKLCREYLTGPHDCQILKEKGLTRYLWQIEVGKGKSSYKPRYEFNNDQPTPSGRPVLYYVGLLTHSGYKKRLVRTDRVRGTRKIIYRDIT